MRATRAIKDYIEESIKAKYMPLIKTAKDTNTYDSKCNSCEEYVKTRVEELNKELTDYLIKNNMYKTTSWGSKCLVDYNDSHIGNDELEQQKRETIKAIEKERDEKIKRVILTLELGGIKNVEALDKMIRNA